MGIEEKLEAPGQVKDHVTEPGDASDENGSDDDIEATPEEVAAAAERYAKVTGDDGFPRGSQYPHAGNIAKKLKDHKGTGTQLAQTIDEILVKYKAWRKATSDAAGDKSQVIAAKVAAFDTYSSFLDTEPVDAFDSRGALVSSALEEFCYYLLMPALGDFPGAILGKQDVYQGLYFTASNFKQMLKLPSVHTPVNTLDFVIGANVKGEVKTEEDASEFPIRLPAVAVECKGYLDRPRFIESQVMAQRIKGAFPQCLYLLVAQSLKLNLKKIGVAPDIDGIYVWRRMQNVDRKIRRKEGIPLKPLYIPAVEHFYDRVAGHLSSDWTLADPFGTGILK